MGIPAMVVDLEMTPRQGKFLIRVNEYEDFLSSLDVNIRIMINSS